MLPYDLTKKAKEDLRQIAKYTVNKWGEKQSLHYASLLDEHFCELADGNAYIRSFSEYPNVFFSKCEHHYIFHLLNNQRPLIIAILHEKMDLLAWIKQRQE